MRCKYFQVSLAAACLFGEKKENASIESGEITRILKSVFEL